MGEYSSSLAFEVRGLNRFRVAQLTSGHSWCTSFVLEKPETWTCRWKLLDSIIQHWHKIFNIELTESNASLT